MPTWRNFSDYINDLDMPKGWTYVSPEVETQEESKPKVNQSRWHYGTIVNGYQEITQLSTNYRKWVNVNLISTNGIEDAFYVTDWLFIPEPPVSWDDIPF